ncbi:MAG: hypothetical protein M0008_05960 [Actinomycetota bacterium]|nr:hypothetical protein [Actinomycetota bacterium]
MEEEARPDELHNLVGDPELAGSEEDPLVEALRLVEGAFDAKVGVKLLGGLAVRCICPDYPPRIRRDQDIDLACLSKDRKEVMSFLESHGCTPDRRFNNLNGDRQMYFVMPSGRPVDVMVDRLTMCHTLDFRARFSTLPYTLDVADLLLSKLQIVELNPKDARDIFHLLSRYPVSGEEPPGGWLLPPPPPRPAEGGQAATIDRTRFEKVLGSDWGWWRTVSGNLDKLASLAAEHPALVLRDAHIDPLKNAARLREIASDAPKSMQWKVRSRVGERLRWYEVPEEVAH